MSVFFHVAWIVARKDLTIEVRSREILYTTLFFAVSCVLVFAVSFVREGQALQDAAAGILWIAIAFAGTLAVAGLEGTISLRARDDERRRLSAW